MSRIVIVDPASRRRSRILIVDDDQAVLSRLHLMLHEHGFEPVAVPCGKEALARLQRESFALLITDLFMPDMDGYELLLSVRAARHSVPVIVMSGGNDMIGIRQTVVCLGGAYFLQKPFSAGEVLEIVRTILGTATGASDAETLPKPDSPSL